MKRALVVSAGGSKGAYAVGIIDYYNYIGKTWDILIGSSTGSLIVPIVASGEIEKLKKGYNSISHNDIFSVNPFKITKSNNGVYKYNINLLSSLYNLFIRKKSTLGDTQILRDKTIPNFFSIEDFNKVILNDIDLSICVSNLTLSKLEVKNISEYSYDKFLDWIWASTCAPPFMSIPVIDNYDYIDGGILQMVPIEQAIIKGADEIDVIVLDKEFPDISEIERVRNLLHFIIKIQFSMMNKIKRQNVNLGFLSNMAEKDIIINLHYTERRLTNNSLIFDSHLMKMWMKEGYEYAKDSKYKSYLISGKNNTYKLI